MIVARYSLWKLAGLLLASVIFVAVGVWMIRNPDLNAYKHLVGWCSVLFFGACGLIMLTALPNRAIIIQIDDQGVFDRRSMIKPIPWSAISSVSETRIRNTAIFGLRLSRPPEEFMPPGFKRRLLVLSRMRGTTPFILTATPFTISTKTLRAALAARVPVVLISARAPARLR